MYPQYLEMFEQLDGGEVDTTRIESKPLTYLSVDHFASLSVCLSVCLLLRVYLSLSAYSSLPILLKYSLSMIQ